MPIRPRLVSAAAAAAVLLSACEAPPTSVITIDVALQQAPGVPTAPINGQATFSPDPYGVRLSWSHDGTGAPTRYDVYWSVNGGEFTFRGSVAGTNTWDFLNDAAETSRYIVYRIYACNAAGCSVVPNEVAVGVPRLEPPGNLTATPAPYSIVLRWADNATNNSDYRISYGRPGGEQYVFVVGPDVTEVKFPAEPGITYVYTVRSRQARTPTEYVNSVSVQVTGATYAAVAAAPYGGTATYDASRHAVRITWAHENTASVRWWTIERKEYGSAEDWQVVHSSTTYWETSHADVLPQDAQGHSWLYRIRACNPSGCSGPNEISIWTPPYAG
ncbi:MAG TPA: fibronectin type III domain-containing protein [Longimicrobium sp.]|nr:fibronectin type III domain-containing protein [Longimicrobium sp.]